MGKETLEQPLLLNQTSSEEMPRQICPQIDGKDWKCGGTSCPWVNNDTASRSEDMKKLSRAVAFCVMFMIVEVVGGIRAGSLAILTDAAHLLSDVASFAISLFAMWAGGWDANPRQTYGFFRLEILGALVSIQIIWLITGIIVYEAIVRLLREPVAIDGRLMFIIASLGLVVNLAMMLLLDHGHDHGHGGSSHGHSHGHGGSSHGHSHGHDHEHSSKALLSNGHGPDDHPHEEHSPDGHEGDHSHDEHGHEHSHDHHGAEHSHDHDDHGHQHQDEDAADHEPLLVTYSGRAMEQSAAAIVLRQNGHKTECVRENIKSPRSGGDTIIMCICDEVERQSESERSVRVTIDHGGDQEGHTGSTKHSSINVRGAYLHVLGDLIQSIGVMIGGAIIWYKPEWKIVDLICTFVFSIVVLATTIKMIRDILEVLMESTPREVDAGALQRGLMEIEGVIAVHELHIWAITVGKVVLACHVMIEPDADSDDLLAEVIQYCDKKYKISHVTIQIERSRE